MRRSNRSARVPPSTRLTTLLFLCQIAATLAMTGLIWFVQVVHNPLFARVGGEGWVAYAAALGPDPSPGSGW